MQGESESIRIARAARVLGIMGGRARTPAKLRAARANGRRGGRPRFRIPALNAKRKGGAR